MLQAQMKPLVCIQHSPPWDLSLCRLTRVACLFYSACFLTLCVVSHLKGESQTSVLRETAALMPWLYYYFTQLSTAIRAISCSNDFCGEKKLNWHWRICPFFYSPARKMAFLACNLSNYGFTAVQSRPYDTALVYFSAFGENPIIPNGCWW